MNLNVWIYIKLAWRNLMRNKRRSFIAGIAIGIGLASLIFVDAVVLGMEDNMIESATSTFLGQGQIYHKGFRQTLEVEDTINKLDTVVSSLQRETIVRHFTLRTMSYAMVSSPANLSSISLVGINPESEKYLSLIDEAVQKGAYFAGDNPRDIVIGNELADLLEVGIGDRVVVTVAQAGSGDLSQELFLVSGIFHLNIKDMDQGMAFIRIDKARRMLALGNGAHIIALDFVSTKYGRNENSPFWDKYSKYGNEARGWGEILPQLNAALELSQFSTYLTGLILFAVVALGIINTLFMSLHERMFEFGVLRAIGTRPFGIWKLIMFEAGALAVISIVLGTILGFIVTYITSLVGINYTGIEFAGVTFRELLYPVMKVRQFTFYPFWVFVFTTLIGIYPAVYAARLSPAGAMRKSL